MPYEEDVSGSSPLLPITFSEREPMNLREKIITVRDGGVVPVSLRPDPSEMPGCVPPPELRAALRLAVAIHAAESTSCVTSWSAQERAEAFYNAHGLGATLSEAERLEGLRLPDASV